jgi:hypothetical protein
MATRTRYRTAGGAELRLIQPLLAGPPRWVCDGCDGMDFVLNEDLDPQVVASDHAHRCHALPRD